MCMVGVPPLPQQIAAFSVILPRRNLAGSCIGGIAETQEMLDFCGKNGIVCDIELIKMQEIEAAYQRMLKSDVKYRFVIDMASLKSLTRYQRWARIDEGKARSECPKGARSARVCGVVMPRRYARFTFALRALDLRVTRASP